jgi:rod shape-determining protein MreC
MSQKATLCLLLCAIIPLVLFPKNISEQISKQIGSLFAFQFNESKPKLSETEKEKIIKYCSTIQKEEENFTEYQASILRCCSEFITVKVLYHQSSAWHHFLWIDQGSENNQAPFPLTLNCPAVIGDVVVGVVDYVGKQSSRIRLISDQALHPAVRVVREHPDLSLLAPSIIIIQKAIRQQENLLPKKELSSTLLKLLDCLYASLPSTSSSRLAKGELQGAISPSTPNIFRGVGFNYNFTDSEGEARDLRTGQKNASDAKLPLLLRGDLLETSGLDGVFPKGLKIARITQITPLTEGAASYTITAESLLPQFPDFEYICLLPALNSSIPSEPSLIDHIEQVMDMEK